MKKTNTIIKQFLHLKEDYTLDLSKEDKNSQIIVEADNADETETEDNVEKTDNADTTEESDNTEKTKDSKIKDTENKSANQEKTDNAEESSKDETQKEVEDDNSTEKSSKDISFTAEKIPEIYSKMESSKSPIDVALALKDFLDEIEKTSLNALLD